MRILIVTHVVRKNDGQGRVNYEIVQAALDDRVPDDCVRLSTAHASTVGAGPMFGTVRVEKAGIPAPPARIRSASVPCGLNSISSSPARYWRMNVAFSPT